MPDYDTLLTIIANRAPKQTHGWERPANVFAMVNTPSLSILNCHFGKAKRRPRIARELPASQVSLYLQVSFSRIVPSRHARMAVPSGSKWHIRTMLLTELYALLCKKYCLVFFIWRFQNQDHLLRTTWSLPPHLISSCCFLHINTKEMH